MIEKICEKCKYHVSVFNGYFGIEETEGLKLIVSSEQDLISRDIYCLKGTTCEILRQKLFYRGRKL